MGQIKELLKFSKRKLFKYSKERLEHQFKNNKWDWLEQLDELPRYSVLIGWHCFHHYGKSILDLGSGQGILLKRFPDSSYSFYQAIDFSPEAISKIKMTNKIKASAADITTYVPDRKFDTIIFNESLYYTKNPLTHLARYFEYLNPDGFIFLSIHRKNYDLVEKIKSHYQVYDENIVTNKANEHWTLLALSSK